MSSGIGGSSAPAADDHLPLTIWTRHKKHGGTNLQMVPRAASEHLCLPSSNLIYKSEEQQKEL